MKIIALSLLVCLCACSKADPQAAADASAIEHAQSPSLPPEVAGRTLIDAKTLKLEYLVARADRIFVGVVKAVDTKTVRLTEGNDSTDAEIREVTFDVLDGIKNTKTGEDVIVRQLPTVSAPLKEGDRVVWFLAKESPLGLTQPLGVYSGDFRVETTDGGTPVVNNLRGNAGLWIGDLFKDDGFERAEVLAAARAMKLPRARIEALKERAVRKPERQSLTLDLLLAATKSQVK